MAPLLCSPTPYPSPPLGRLPSLRCPGQPAKEQGWGCSVASVCSPLTGSFSEYEPTLGKQCFIQGWSGEDEPGDLFQGPNGCH